MVFVEPVELGGVGEQLEVKEPGLGEERAQADLRRLLLARGLGGIMGVYKKKSQVQSVRNAS
jgi:hypothetical protein